MRQLPRPGPHGLQRRAALAGLALPAGLWPWRPGVASPGAQAHALLIGVGEIDVLPRRLWLRGPANDVALMRDTLLARGFTAERITVLADGVERPTKAAITQALATLLQRVQLGDRVVLHLAGHGVQVPHRDDKAHAEPDGLDEVFLTADVGRWQVADARLPNALTDAEIGAWMDAVVDRGGFVWGIFDTCHAAGMSRADGGGARWRSVAGVELGVPTDGASRPAPTRPRSPGALPQRLDGRVLAYAARSHEPTGEEYLPRGAGLAKARPHGVFTFAVAQAVRANATTVVEVLASVRQQYAAQARLAPTPLVLGDATARLPPP